MTKLALSSLCALTCALASTAAQASPRRATPGKEARTRDHRRPTPRQAPRPDAPTPVVQVEVDVQGPSVDTRSSSQSRVDQVQTRRVHYKAPEPQPVTAEDTGPDRDWHLGVDLGGGGLGAGLASSLDAYVGLRILGFALQVEVWAQSHDYFKVGDGRLQTFVTLNAKLWLSERVSTKIGMGSANMYDDGRAVVRGTSLLAAGEFEFLDTPSVVFSAFAKTGLGLYRERGAVPTASVGLGFTWY